MQIQKRSSQMWLPSSVIFDLGLLGIDSAQIIRWVKYLVRVPQKILAFSGQIRCKIKYLL